MVKQIILDLAKTAPGVGELMLEGAMFSRKLALLSDIGKTLLAERPNELKELSEILADVRANNENRTTAIHSIWEPSGPQQSLVATMRAKKGNTRQLNEKEIFTLSERLVESTFNLIDFVLRTWPETFSAGLATLNR